ncbi:MAG: AAA family ATPase, partial [Verrucomicrobia bacterium]|nr:AAA family ATPase [Verrucomicrobiota bacterium]
GKSRTVAEAAHAIRTLTGQDPFVLAPQGKQAIALSKAIGGTGAHTIAGLRAHKGWQAQAAGRVIFVDEFSQVGNADMQWLLDFALKNRSSIVFWGDRKQYQAITRGDPVSDLIERNLVEHRELTKIYRQKNPALLAAVVDSAEGRVQESVDKLKEAGAFRVEQNEAALRKAIVADMVNCLERNEPVLAIALQHRDGEAITCELRAKLKEEGLLGQEDREVRWLKPVELTDAQRSDPVNYQSKQILKFHRLAAGGFKSGQAWSVERVEGDHVIVSRDGQEKPLPLSDALSFQVYEAGVMALAPGDRILITKNNPRANVRTGDLCQVRTIDDRYLTLDNGKKLDITEGVHCREGYTVTGFVSQGSEKATVLSYFPGSAAHMINQRTWHVNISRAVKSLRIYTDCLPLIEQRAVTPEDRRSATELVRGDLDGGSKAAGELMVDKVVDLQPGKRVKSPRQLEQEIIPFLRAQAKTAHKAEIARLSALRDHEVAMER